jgi:ATP-binding cassette, subfamily B, bacterial
MSTRSVVSRLRRLLQYARPYRKGWLRIVGVTLLSSAFALLQPWPMKVLVDHILASRPMSPVLETTRSLLPGASTRGGLLIWVAMAGVVVFALNILAEVVLTFAWIRVGQRMVYDLAADLFAAIQRRSLAYHARQSVGDAMTRVGTDSWVVHTIIGTLLFAPLQALLTALGMIALMAHLDVGLTLLACAVVPIIVATSLVAGQRVRAIARAKRKVESRMHAHVQQTLAGIPVVQAFGAEERQRERFDEFADDAVSTHRKSALIGGMAGLTTGLANTAARGAVLWFGATKVIDGHLSLGGLLVFTSYLGSLQTQFKTLAGMYRALQRASASIERTSEILEASPEVVEAPQAAAFHGRSRGVVAFENVVFGYDSGRPVLKGIELLTEPGETIALVGSTGAGKSTLGLLIPRLFDPWSGRVWLDGHDVRLLTLSSLRDQVAIVPQEAFLFPMTVAENIAYGRPKATRPEIEAAARAAGAHAFIERLPSGYDTVIGERGATLSGGERQRVSIARAFLKDAPVLVLDEPTSALDASTEAALVAAIQRLSEGRTTFVIAHRLSSIRRAGRIVVLDDGRIVEMGSHNDLVAAGGVYHSLYTLQSSAASHATETAA